MGAVTYPDDKVADFIAKNMIPLQVKADHPLAGEFKVTWTPTICVLDFYGKEHHRTVGFFPPEEFIPSLLLGMGKVDFDGVVKDVCLAYLPELAVGDYTIVHVGFAITQIDEQSARETLDLFHSLGILEEELRSGEGAQP